MKIKYISWLSQQIGKEEDRITIETDLSLKDLYIKLAAEFSGYHSELFNNRGIVRASICGKVVNEDFIIQDDMEITLFAPMSGG